MMKRAPGIRRSDVLRWSLLAVLGATAHVACTERQADDDGGNDAGSDSGPGGSAGLVVGNGSGGLVTACDDPEPLLVRGEETGFVSCGDEGPLHRPERKICPSFVPRAEDIDPVNPESGGGGEGGSPFDECTNDADCEGPYAHCVEHPPVAGVVPSPAYLGCKVGCVSDDDCDSSELCLCGDPVGTCVPATCKTDADCDGECLGTPSIGCGVTEPEFSCVGSDDQCLVSDDCEAGYCGSRRCYVSPSCGRPFLVGQVERLAELELRDDWLESSAASTGVMGAVSTTAPELGDLTEAERARLAEHWARAGLMEHASIAAFARFTLQLLALGAPVELVERSNAATLDETKHARRCFAQASRFAARDLGPSALGMHGALGEVSLAGVLELVLLEGCVGETVAALEAGAARDCATDAEVRALLGEIADDEARHAELAWRFVSWALEREPGLAGVCARVFGALREEVGGERVEAAAPSAPASRLEAFGLLDEATRRALRTEALEAVVLPCASALFGRTERGRLPMAPFALA